MQKIKSGNINYMTELFNRYNNMILNYFCRLSGDFEDSRDLTQSVFLRLIRYRKSYNEEGVFKFWLYRMALNTFRSYYSVKQKRKEKHKSYVENDLSAAAYEDCRDEDDNLLFQSLLKLPLEYREIIILSKFQGIKYKDIAYLFSTTEASIKNKMLRAMEKLRKIYFETEKAKKP